VHVVTLVYLLTLKLQLLVVCNIDMENSQISWLELRNNVHSYLYSAGQHSCPLSAMQWRVFTQSSLIISILARVSSTGREGHACGWGPCLWEAGKVFYARRQLKHYCYIIKEKAVKAVVLIEIPYNYVHKIVYRR